MELKASPVKRGLSPPDSVSNPEEKEMSDEDDDDRNHKHRRRETGSQSSERDAPEQVYKRPYRKGNNKPFDNGHQSSERKHPGLTPFSRDMNQRSRVNHFVPGDPGRGRGRETGSWNQRDSSRFMDMSSQMIQQGPVPPSMFAGRGMPNVSNAQSGASWGPFGLPNGFQGNLRPSINPPFNIGLPRQRCRDFEERGFCLRGDMCPMEHGVNRIVVEDVQSLSQFNLPVTLPNSHMMGAPAGPVPLSAINAPSSTMMNGKGLHSKNSKPGMGDNGLSSNGAFVGSGVAGGGDVYDPDQPLWASDRSETSAALLNTSKIDESDFFVDANPSDDQVRLSDNSDYGHAVRSTGNVGTHNTTLSVWGRIGGSKNKPEEREKIGSTISSSNYIGNETKGPEPSNSSQGITRQGKKINRIEMDPSLKTQSGTARNMRKPSQMAQRTLFVSGIPQNNNKKESLLSHFQKFGKVIDIYIPSDRERAFVQFSTREEADAALNSPDAVMGNRFIRLSWANRDNISDNGISTGNSASLTPRVVTVDKVPSSTSVPNKVNVNLLLASPMGSINHASVSHLSSLDRPKPLLSNGPKAPLVQKKMENLEVLREQLRKKQEMLDQKRNDFKQKLDKLEKQATGLKSEMTLEQAAKKQKVETVSDVVVSPKATTCTGSGAVMVSPKASPPGETVTSLKAASPEKIVAQTEAPANCSTTPEKIMPHNFKALGAVTLQEPAALRQSVRPLAPLGAPFVMNKFKLDNRPTAFKIIPPLPADLANVDALKEHFSTYGDVVSIDLEESESQENSICFKTRRSAEMAFLNGKSWKGHNLQFSWLAAGDKENASSSSKGSLDANIVEASSTMSTLKKAISGEEGESENKEKRDDESLLSEDGSLVRVVQ